MMMLSWRKVWFGIALVGLMLIAGGARAEVDPPGDVRDHLTVDELIAKQPQQDGPIHNGWFMPVGDAGPAHHAFSGHIIFTQAEMGTNPVFVRREVLGGDPVLFPGVTLTFFSDDGVLIPASQDIIRETPGEMGTSFWQIIVQPGRVWSEPGDDGWSRASFPFALMNELENDTHNGIATFVYDDGGVSDVRFQIVQQTAPYFISDHFHAWGQLAADYQPAGDDAGAAVIEAYRREMADRFPVADWSVLEDKVGKEALENFEGVTDPDYRVISGLVIDGVLYHKPSSTPWGDYPYSRDMRFGVWSVTKSVGPTLGMLRLAQKFGPEVFDLKIVDYVTINPDHDGWDNVTFGDALNMATGIGGGDTDRDASMSTGYGEDNYDVWYMQPDAASKIVKVEETGNYPWGPGEVARYRDRDMFLLGVAMNAYLKSQEGPDADIWTMIAEEVLKPIGIHHAPKNRTVEPDGSLGQPLMVWGYYPSLDDLAKIADLYHHHGRHDGEQLLPRDLTASLFSQDGAFDQQRINAVRFYKMGLHATVVPNPTPDESLYVPYMNGWVGNLVVLLPDDTTAIRISKTWPAYDYLQTNAANPYPMIKTVLELQGTQIGPEDHSDATSNTSSDVQSPGDVRDRLTFDELMTSGPNRDGPIHNDYFMPIGNAEPAHHEFEGVLGFIGAPFFVGERSFPGFKASFFTTDGYLVPVERGIIQSLSGRSDIILSPGRVWSEPGDDGWSRASFPFVLAGRTWNDSHNGLATFLYNDTEVSDLTLQIVQEAASWSRIDAWSQLRLIYRPGPVEGKSELVAAFDEELAQRIATASLDSLNADSRLIDGMERGLKHVTVTGLLDDGVLYRTPCYTRFGDYPYCDEMRHGVFSVTKSAGAALSLLWLAERYGPEVFDAKIADYVDVTADHDGWNDVTFRDAIDMATGIGEMAPDRISVTFDIEADEDRFIGRFGNALGVETKLDVVFEDGNYEWGPGEVVRYNSLHTFTLAVAMDAYVKAKEGPDAHLWEMVSDEVLRPIGITAAPLMHTREADGSRGVPIMGWGFFPTLDDLAKIAQLFLDRGAHDGRQLLYGDEIDLLLDGSGGDLTVPWQTAHGTYRYDFSFWYMPYRGQQRCDVMIPEMMGFGGNLVTLMPNGMTGIRLADADDGSYGMWDGENMAALADNLRSFCE